MKTLNRNMNWLSYEHFLWTPFFYIFWFTVLHNVEAANIMLVSSKQLKQTFFQFHSLTTCKLLHNILKLGKVFIKLLFAKFIKLKLIILKNKLIFYYFRADFIRKNYFIWKCLNVSCLPSWRTTSDWKMVCLKNRFDLKVGL